LGAFVAYQRTIHPTQSADDVRGQYVAVLSTGELAIAMSMSYGQNILIDSVGRIRQVTGAVVDPINMPAPIRAPPPPAPPPKLTRAEAWMLIDESAASAALSLILLIAGPRLVRKAKTTAHWARTYVFGRIVLNILGTALGVECAAAIYANFGLPAPDLSAQVFSSCIGFVLSNIVPTIMVWVTSGELAKAYLSNEPA
jgi:hypothetical protein